MSRTVPTPQNLFEHVPLGPLSTIGIGGPARYFLKATTDDELRAGLEWARDADLPMFVLGGGSNVLISDAGFPGLVIQLAQRGIDVASKNTVRLVTAAAGEIWDEFASFCIERNLAGVECLSGIPGLVGASPIQNIGAYGQEVSDTIHRVEAIDRLTGETISFTADECAFGYRTSRFKTVDKDRYVITSVTFGLTPDGPPSIRYADLAQHFEGVQLETVSLSELRNAVLTIRRRKAMVIDETEPNSRSCGSFFTNPIVDSADVRPILERGLVAELIRSDEKMPVYDCGGGKSKLSAAWLMSHSGLQRGMRHKGVGLSQKHVLAIVNYDNGTASDVLELVEIVRQKVYEAFHINLEPEPIMVGRMQDKE